jgi:hypothetical protein
MIWNDRILFIHAPKTGGMSITKMLLESLYGHVVITGHIGLEGAEGEKLKKIGRTLRNKLRKKLLKRLCPKEAAGIGITYVPGKRHETLNDAESILNWRNRSVDSFETVFSVMRNPYDLELSRYAYLRKGHPWDEGVAQSLALKGNFKEYLRTAPFLGKSPPRVDLYYHLRNNLIDNLVLLRFERLAKDVERYMSPYLMDGYVLPHENRSEHVAYRDKYDAECEELCFQRHRWFFEKGFYEREEF